MAGSEATVRALLLQGADAAPLRASGALTVKGPDRDWACLCAAFGLVDGAANPAPRQ